MTQDRKTLLALTALLLLSCALFLTWNAPQGEWGYILPLRGAKLAALLLVAYSVGVSTLLFQTLTNNPILTPSVLGFDALYVFLQTLLVFALGVLVFVVAGRLGRSTTVVAHDGESAADDEQAEDQAAPEDSDVDDIVGAGVSEEESAHESTLESF